MWEAISASAPGTSGVKSRGVMSPLQRQPGANECVSLDSRLNRCFENAVTRRTGSPRQAQADGPPIFLRSARPDGFAVA